MIDFEEKKLIDSEKVKCMRYRIKSCVRKKKLKKNLKSTENIKLVKQNFIQIFLV